MADEYTNNPEQSRESIAERYGRQRDMSKVTFIPARKEIRPFDPTSILRVVVYCRVSTDGLSQATSFELQKNYYLRYVRQRPGWKLVALYSDEGITATSMDKREGLLKMLEDARAGKFDIIIVKNLSRLNRNLSDCLSVVYELRNLPHPVGILFESENMFTLDKNIDFTLTVLSLVAEEESHKKSEAQNASIFMRYSQGDYLKPDLLGYRRVGINEIEVEPEEAKTVKLIFDMYLAGYLPETIANVLMKLGRKTHSHITKSGKVVGGNLKWTGSSVKSIICNERRAGDVLAQKTYTPNFKDHKSVANRGALPQFYARDQHEAIVSRDDYLLANRILNANYGGWKYGLQQMEVFESGAFKGFVGTSPNWRGFNTEDYNRAGLRACGYAEDSLQEIENRIIQQIEEEEKKRSASSIGFQHRYSIDSDNYELFPDVDVVVEEEKQNKPEESFSKWVDKANSDLCYEETDKYKFSRYDFSSCEVIRPEYFSVREKAHVTFDNRGLFFNCECNKRLSVEETVENVDVFYNPTEHLIMIKKANEKTSKSLHWMRYNNNSVNMKRCSSVGLTSAVYENMGWEPDFKYRVLGTLVEVEGEDILVFALDDNFMIVPAKKGTFVSLDTSKLTVSEAKEMMREGTIPDNEVVPDLDDFHIGNGPMSKAAKIMARSRAIYFDEFTDRVSGTLHVEELEDKKFDPRCIQSLIQRGITPEEGWIYLKGVAVIRENSFTIFPEKWIGNCGDNYYESSGFKIRHKFSDENHIGKGQPYGWTVDLSLPSAEEIKSEIQTLKEQMIG